MTTEQQTKKGEARVNALLDAAAEAFLERGFDAPPINDIIEQVGGSLRNVYSHFGGKSGLFEQSIERLCARITDQMEAGVVPGKPLKNNLETLGKQFIRIATSPQTLSLHRLMIAEGKRFPILAQTIYAAGHSRGANQAAVLIQQHLDEEGTRCAIPVTPIVLGQMFVHMVTSEIQINALISRGAEACADYDQHVRACVEVLLNGILPTRLAN